MKGRWNLTSKSPDNWSLCPPPQPRGPERSEAGCLSRVGGVSPPSHDAGLAGRGHRLTGPSSPSCCEVPALSRLENTRPRHAALAEPSTICYCYQEGF